MSLDVAPLYEREREAVVRYFERRLGGRWQDADDLAAEVWARVWAKRATYCPMAGIPLRSWLFKVCHNLLVDYWRTRRPSVSLDALREASCTLRFEETERRTEVGAAVAALGAMQRAVIIGRFWEGRRHDEMGHVTTVAGSKKLQDRALVNLRKVLDGCGSCHDCRGDFTVKETTA